jgi:hypothetical protein
LDDNVPQTTVSVEGGFVRLLARLWKLSAAKVQIELIHKLLARKCFQARDAVSVVIR